ncbi:MAG: FHA domain-containing protein [Butyrivibrio sp.]|nr:FHA domain-containing protein [Butyrivibrio sp.]
MMEFNFYRDIQHNYMVIKGEKDSNYQYRMFTSNKIKGLLPCSEHNINTTTYLYYEIDSKQSLKNRYAYQKLSYEKLVRLLKNIIKVSDSISAYLLSFDGIILSTEYIYESIEDGEHYFTFYPLWKNDNDINQFTTDLLELTDPEDEKAQLLIYRLCDLAQNQGISFTEIIRIGLSESEKDKDKKEIVQKKTVQIEDDFEENETDLFNIEENNDADEIKEERNKNYKRNELEREKMAEYDEDLMSYEDEMVVSKGRKKDNKGKKIYVINFVVSGLFLTVVAALFYIRTVYILTYNETLVTLIIMMVSIICSLISFIMGIINKAKIEDTDKIVAEEDEEEFEENYQDEFIETYMDMPYEDKKNSQFYSESGNNCENYGETILLEDAMNTSNLKLYGKDVNGTVSIDLTKLPIIIGKLPGAVNYVLKDDSISRIHAKIYKNESDELCIQDLNSKNATYINHKKLCPNESEVFGFGDEISFGRLSFNCR